MAHFIKGLAAGLAGLVGFSAAQPALRTELADYLTPKAAYAQQNGQDPSASIPYRTVDETLAESNFRSICSNNYSEEISKGNVVVFFYDNGSDYSRRLAEVVRDTHSEFEGRVKFTKYLDNCERPDLNRMLRSRMQEYGLKGIPAIVFYKDGKMVYTATGGPNRDNVNDWKIWFRKQVSDSFGL